MGKTIYVISCNGVPVIAFTNHKKALAELERRKETLGVEFTLDLCDLETKK